MRRKRSISYASSGVSIAAADRAKERMERMLRTSDKRVLNSVGAFASLVDGRFPGYRHPVLVLKTEEPGSKQLLAFQHGRIESICEDMINHLINDIAVMGALPVAVQDAVICGKLEEKIVTRIVDGISRACRAQGCTLVGGETSEQPGVIAPGTYILTSSVVGIVEKAAVIDGSRIKRGDAVLAIASNGLHTNGYSLVRRLLKSNLALARHRVGKTTFLEAILRPHTCYLPALRGLLRNRTLHGMAHITGSGMEGNLERILPRRLDAVIDLAAVRVLPVFRAIRNAGRIGDQEMLRTYNMGVGLIVVCAPKAAPAIASHIRKHGHACYPIGEIVSGKGNVRFRGKLRWPV